MRPCMGYALETSEHARRVRRNGVAATCISMSAAPQPPHQIPTSGMWEHDPPKTLLQKIPIMTAGLFVSFFLKPTEGKDADITTHYIGGEHARFIGHACRSRNAHRGASRRS